MERGTRAQLVERYKEGARVFAEALDGITDGELDARSGPEEWTAREVVHHMADSEMTSAIRLRRLIAEDAPTIQGYDQEEYAQRLFYAERPIEASVEAVTASRQTTGDILDRLDRGAVGAGWDAHGERPLRRQGVARDLRGPRPRPRGSDPPGSGVRSSPLIAADRRGGTALDGATGCPDCRSRSSAACPTLTKGRFAYDFGDTAQLTPLLPMYRLGHDFVPAPVHAGASDTTATPPRCRCSSATAIWRRPRIRRTRCSRPPCCSPRPRASPGA